MNANEYIIVGKVRDWHQPKNDLCPHNRNLSDDCTCKLIIPKRATKRHKPRIIFRVTDPTVSGHKIKPQLVAELHDDGKLIIREAMRRISYETTLGQVYSRLVWNHARQKATERKRARHEAKKSTKAVKRLALRLLKGKI